MDLTFPLGALNILASHIHLFSSCHLCSYLPETKQSSHTRNQGAAKALRTAKEAVSIVTLLVSLTLLSNQVRDRIINRAGDATTDQILPKHQRAAIKELPLQKPSGRSSSSARKGKQSLTPAIKPVPSHSQFLLYPFLGKRAEPAVSNLFDTVMRCCQGGELQIKF